MTKSEYRKLLLHIVYDLNTHYSNEYPKNCGYRWADGSYSFDCWNLNKTIWWGWTDGFSMGSYLHAPGKNGIGDWTGSEIMKHCDEVSSDFKKIPELDGLYMPDNGGHYGTFIGLETWEGYSFNVVECTPQTDYFLGGVLLSYVDENGYRYNHKGGARAGKWTMHGTTSWITDDIIVYQKIYEDKNIILGKVDK